MIEGRTGAPESQPYLTVHVQIHNLPQLKYQQLLQFMFERAKVGDAVEQTPMQVVDDALIETRSLRENILPSEWEISFQV
jgi:hypothetical protein